MSWADLYFICFVVGFALSLISVFGGIFHVPGLHHGHHVDHVHIHIGDGHQHHGAGTQVSPFNLSTITAFLAWFGGVGYLLTVYSSVWLGVGLLIATASGLVGSSIVFLFLVKVLLAHDKPLNAADYDMIGVLGRLTSAIHSGGTGEIAFSQGGVRRSAAARSEDGIPIEKGTEVVVTRYDKGIAYVRPWEDLSDSKETL
jgi:membrane protein implicated in regulation of membrane protease activity